MPSGHLRFKCYSPGLIIDFGRFRDGDFGDRRINKFSVDIRRGFTDRWSRQTWGLGFGFGLRPALLWKEFPRKLVFQLRDELLGATGASGQCLVPQPASLFDRLLSAQPISPIGNGTVRGEVVSQQWIAPKTGVCGRTRPRVIFGMLNQSCPDRVAFHIANRTPEVRFIHTGKEAPLPEMSRGAVAMVEVKRVGAMSVADGWGQRPFVFRHGNEVDMIGHQRVGPNFQSVSRTSAREESKINPPILVIDERDDTPVTALCDVMRTTGHHNPCKPGQTLTGGSSRRRALPLYRNGASAFKRVGPALGFWKEFGDLYVCPRNTE